MPKYPALPDDQPLFADGDPLVNTSYILKHIQFQFNSYALLPVSYPDLDRVIAHMKKNPDLFITLSGHTDDLGTPEYNASLSSDRAKSVAAYLISKGIEEARISTFGFGESRPITDADGHDAADMNRRVEIEFHR
jgi:OOP family OmpA-OmpF porin